MNRASWFPEVTQVEKSAEPEETGPVEFRRNLKPGNGELMSFPFPGNPTLTLQLEGHKSVWMKTSETYLTETSETHETNEKERYLQVILCVRSE